MDIEWAKDGRTGELFIVQARPETVHASRDVQQFEHYRLQRTRPRAGDRPQRRQRNRDRTGARDSERRRSSAVPAGRSPGHRQDGSRLGTDHEEGSRDRDQPRRPDVSRGDRQPRARRARPSSAPKPVPRRWRRADGHGLVRRRRHRIRLRGRAPFDVERVDLSARQATAHPHHDERRQPGRGVRAVVHPQRRCRPRPPRVHHQQHDRRPSDGAGQI